MNASPFVVRLRQELIRSRKKSAILGVLCLVAGYFWAPLVWKWMFPASRAKSHPVAEQTAASATPVAESADLSAEPAPANGALAATAAAVDGWRAAAEALAADLRMRPAEAAEAEFHPFAPPPWRAALAAAEAAAEQEAEFAEEAPEETAAPPRSPAERGYQVTSIVLGPRLRAATINGAMIREGQPVGAAADGAVYVLREVRPRCVVLAQGEQEWVLELPAPFELARRGTPAAAVEEAEGP